MKYFLLFLTFSQVAMAANVPVNWVSEISHKHATAKASQQISGTSEYLESVFGIQERVLTAREDRDLKGFRLSHYVTDFSVNKSGLFGLSALAARSAVEVKWSKVAAQPTLAPLSEVEITNDSLEALSMTAAEVESLALSSGRISPDSGLRGNIQAALNDAKTMMDQIDGINAPGWRLASLRLDLFFGAKGKVWTYANVGAFVRVRIDWKKIKRSVAPTAALVSSTKTTRFVGKILQDLNEIYADENLPGFKVKIVNVGVGAIRKGCFFGLGTSRAAFIGFLRFEPVRNPAMKLLTEEDQLSNEDMELSTEESDQKNLRFMTVPRKKWKNGLAKSLELTRFFANSAARFDKSWKISEIKTVFELTQTGFLGLASTTGMGVIETELVRK